MKMLNEKHARVCQRCDQIVQVLAENMKTRRDIPIHKIVGLGFGNYSESEGRRVLHILWFQPYSAHKLDQQITLACDDRRAGQIGISVEAVITELDAKGQGNE